MSTLMLHAVDDGDCWVVILLIRLGLEDGPSPRRRQCGIGPSIKGVQYD
jgi:hypothetical protein